MRKGENSKSPSLRGDVTVNKFFSFLMQTTTVMGRKREKKKREKKRGRKKQPLKKKCCNALYFGGDIVNTQHNAT